MSKRRRSPAQHLLCHCSDWEQRVRKLAVEDWRTSATEEGSVTWQHIQGDVQARAWGTRFRRHMHSTSFSVRTWMCTRSMPPESLLQPSLMPCATLDSSVPRWFDLSGTSDATIHITGMCNHRSRSISRVARLFLTWRRTPREVGLPTPLDTAGHEHYGGKQAISRVVTVTVLCCADRRGFLLCWELPALSVGPLCEYVTGGKKAAINGPASSAA